MYSLSSAVKIPNRLNEKGTFISLFFAFSSIVCLLVIPD